MKNLKFKIHWSFFVLGILMLIYGKFQTFLCSLLCVLLHEMGHSFVGKKLGYKLNLITLTPYGAMLSGNNSPFNADDEIKIAVAGPLVNLALVVISVALWWIFPVLYNFTFQFVWVNIYTFIFNILPMYPLDGGRILKALVAKKWGGAVARKILKIFGIIITSIMFLMFFVSFFYTLNYMLGINALFLLVCLLDNSADAYYEKLATFYAFNPSNKTSVAVDAQTPIFVVYKKLNQTGAKQVVVTKNGQPVKYIKKNDVCKKILSLPINTNIENI